MKNIFLGSLLLSSAVFVGGLSAFSAVASPINPQDPGFKQDMKNAGHNTKNAAKDTGHGVKSGTKKTGHAIKHDTKRGAHATAKKTDQGARKVERKTAPDQ